jgi:hypothetical protein
MAVSWDRYARQVAAGIEFGTAQNLVFWAAYRLLSKQQAACSGQLRHQTEHATGHCSTRPIEDFVGNVARIDSCGPWPGFV